MLTEQEHKVAVELAWRMGRLNYRRRNTQIYIKQETDKAKLVSRKIYWETTRRLGKSSELLATFTEHCIERAGWKAGFFAPVKDGLLDYIEPIIRKTYTDCPQEIYPRFDRNRFMLFFPNNSCIIFRGANNKQHRVRRGQEFNEAGIDEARDVDELDVLIESVIMPAMFSAAEGWLYISSTPADTRSHPLYRYREQAQKEGWLVRVPIWDANRMDPLVYTKDRIDEWHRETLKGLDGDEAWKREYECEWVVNKNRLIIPEWLDQYEGTLPKDDLFQFYDKYFGLDIGSVDKTVGLYSWYDFRQATINFEDETVFEGRQWTTDDLASQMRIKEFTHWGLPGQTEPPKVYRRVADSDNQILLADLTHIHKMPIMPTTKNSLNAMVNQARMWVKAGRVRVHPRCKLLLATLKDGIWNKTKDEFDRTITLGHMDALAAFIYAIRNIDEVHNPVPVTYGFDPAHQIYPTAPKSQTTQAMERAMINSNPFLHMNGE